MCVFLLGLQFKMSITNTKPLGKNTDVLHKPREGETTQTLVGQKGSRGKLYGGHSPVLG